jgi:integrase
MVPLHPSLGHALRDYALQRDRQLGPSVASSSFFQTSHRSPYEVSDVDKAFRRIRRFLGWEQFGIDHPPTPHSLRHSFAHECLLRWYREGADIQAKLPLLSTYMGHVNIAATQIYLQGLLALHEAAMRRFAEYGGAIIACEEDINESK